MDEDRLDLDTVLHAVTANRITIEHAEKVVVGFTASYVKPKPVSDDFVDWWERAEDLKEQLERAVERLNADDSVGRVIDIGRVLAAASGLLSEYSAATVHGLVGRRLCQLGAWDAALQPLETAVTALADAQVQELSESAADAWFLRIFALDQLKRFAEIVQHVSGAVMAARQLNRTLDEARLNRYAAGAARQLGDRTAAVEFARSAVSAAEQVDWSTASPQEASLSGYFQQLGLLARNAGRVDEAIQAYSRGREAALVEKNAGQAALLLSEIGMTWEMAGERERAIELREEAAREAEELGATKLAARWRQRFDDLPAEGDDPARLAWVNARLEDGSTDLGEVEKIALELVGKFGKAGEPELEAMARNLLASVRVRQGRWQLAEATMAAAVNSAEKGGTRILALQFRLNYANLLGQRGRFDDALPVLTAAIETGERLRGESTMNETSQVIGALLERGYSQLAFTYAVTFDPGGGKAKIPPNPDLAFDVSQRARATNLNATIALSNAAEVTRSSELAARVLALRAAEVAIEASAEGLSVLRPQLVQAQASRRAEMQAALRESGINVSGAKGRTIAELQESLGPNDLFIDLTSIAEGVTAIVVRQTGAGVDLIPWPRAKRLDFVRQWRRSLGEFAQVDVTRRPGEYAHTSVNSALISFWSELEEKLWRRLVELGDGFRDVSRILVVPHQELFMLPYWQLEKSAPGCRLSLLPSIQSYDLLRARTGRVRGPRVAVGDATGTLRGSQREIASLGEHIACPPERSELLRLLPGAGIVHFAGHGFFDHENPYLSGLAVRRGSESAEDDYLGRADPWGVGDCDILTVAQIVATLQLPKCYLTVLSACESGLPRVHPSSEFTSLPASFLIAGARNAIASVWPAHDGAATLMMAAFYRSLDRGRNGDVVPSGALAEARAELAAMSREAVVEALGSDRFVPHRELPFAAPLYLDAFQHYGPD